MSEITVLPEGRPIFSNQSGQVIGWLYLWNDETLGVLWLTEVRENFYLEHSALLADPNVKEFLSNL